MGRGAAKSASINARLRKPQHHGARDAAFIGGRGAAPVLDMAGDAGKAIIERPQPYDIGMIPRRANHPGLAKQPASGVKIFGLRGVEAGHRPAERLAVELGVFEWSRGGQNQQ
jgi:hypothetical protein